VTVVRIEPGTSQILASSLTGAPTGYCQDNVQYSLYVIGRGISLQYGNQHIRYSSIVCVTSSHLQENLI
jgi:hypothetical protein